MYRESKIVCLTICFVMLVTNLLFNVVFFDFV